MSRWWNGIATRVKALPREAILTQAGEALAYWLTANRMVPEELEQRLLAGEPVLTQALASIPPDEAARARQLAAPFVRELGPEDYPKVLQALASHPECAAHAQMLYSRYYYSHFVPAMEEAKQWMITPAPGTPS